MEERQDVGREAGCGRRQEDETLRSFFFVLEGGLGLLSIPAVDRTFIHTVIYVRYTIHILYFRYRVGIHLIHAVSVYTVI